MAKYKAEKQRQLARKQEQKTRFGKRKLASIPRPRMNQELRKHLVYTSTITKAFMQRLAKKRFLYQVENEKKRRTIGGPDVELVSLSAGLHDIGKTRERVSKAIAGTKRLGAHRKNEMKRHVTKGVEILNEISNGLPGNKRTKVIKIVESHHEHWNGSGYPEGLRGTQIPIGGRVLSIVDAFCALTEKRSYKEGKPVPVTLKILQKESGNLFDPELVQEFLEFAENRDFKMYQPTRRITAKK